MNCLSPIKSDTTDDCSLSTADNTALEANIENAIKKNTIAKKIRGPRSKYEKPSKQVRNELLNLIFEEGLSIRQAAKKLDMNYSTAKSIMHLYKVEGRLGNDRFEIDFKKRFEDDKLVNAIPVEPQIFPDFLLARKQLKTEDIIQKRDPFTCLLYHQRNSVSNRPRGFISSNPQPIQNQTRSLYSNPLLLNNLPENLLKMLLVCQ